jgi:tetratricopeptide (TPR) repeat protein
VRRTHVLFALITLASLAPAAHASVGWTSESYDQILARAKKENKHVFIDFYAVWCGPCKRMDEVTFTDPKVQELLGSMIAADWDAEKEPWIAVAKKYKVSAYPTLLVIGPDGTEVDRHLGLLEPAEFIETIDGFRKGIGTVAALEKELETRPNDVELLYKVGAKHAEAGRSEAAAAALNRVLTLDPHNATRNPEILYRLGDAYYNDQKYTEAKPYFSRLVSDYASSEIALDGMKRLAATEYKLGNADAAVAMYAKSIEGKENDANALNGFAWFCAQRKIGLDRALPAAQKAADLSGRDPGILDTLAEVYFAMGDYDNAIKVEKEAAAKDPNDKYLKEQIERFEKARDADQARR